MFLIVAPLLATMTTYVLAGCSRVTGASDRTICPRTHVRNGAGRIGQTLALFPSVSLLSFEATITLPPLASGEVRGAFVPMDEMPSKFDLANLGHQAGFFHSFFAPAAAGSLSVSLPVGHTFGSELRGLNLLTSPPSLVVCVTNTPDTAAKDATAIISWRYVVSVSGVMPMYALGSVPEVPLHQ